MYWVWLRTFFIRINLIWSLVTLGLSASSVYLGMWISEKRLKKAEKVLSLLIERVHEQKQSLFSEYRFKCALLERMIDGFLDLEVDLAAAPFFAKEKAILKGLAFQIGQPGSAEDHIEAITCFDRHARVVLEELEFYREMEEDDKLFELQKELQRCEKRSRVYRSSVNDAIRIFNLALSHY